MKSTSENTPQKSTTTSSGQCALSGQCDRRALLAGGAVALAAAAGYPLVRNAMRPKASVFVAAGQQYDGNLVQTIRDGLVATGFVADQLRGRRVLLKPNLVEPNRDVPHMTTHPAVIVATAEVFRGWGATVVVGEGPGHVRDTEMALYESGVQDALDDAGLTFADLNYEDVAWVKNRGRTSKLAGFYFPRSIIEADLVVSLPKLKTHHLVGMTAAMKNLYGTLPGIKYGWPKNVLHYAGIPESIYDINASLPKTVTVVDGIMCMEGDGPLVGTPKTMGVLLVGTNLTAVDATAARIIGLEPTRIRYLQLAADQLGPLAASRIEQRGTPWQQVHEPFEVLNVPHLQELRTASAIDDAAREKDRDRPVLARAPAKICPRSGKVVRG